MKCTELFVERARDHRQAPALWLPGQGETTFGALLDMASRAQRLLRKSAVRPGAAVLVLDGLGPRLYATAIAALSLGATMVLVEPWMPVDRIERIVGGVAPALFLSSTLGLAWGARVRAIRAIPRWAHASRIGNEPAGAVELVDMPPETPGMITFTSGTTGQPKGVVRGVQYLLRQYEVLAETLHLHDMKGADLSIFANFVLVNLAAGRLSLVVPPSWARSDLWRIDHLPRRLQPTSLTCGPAFLHRAVRRLRLPRLHSIHVGGALSDNAWMDEVFAAWPGADVAHVYGSSEAEPVALCDAREAVRKSRAEGWFQTLLLGKPVARIDAQREPDTVWVTGPHVCPMYVGNDEENRLYKRKDEQGRIWHDMGDRIAERDGMWWYAGRSRQPEADFILEQRIYSSIGSSAAFVHRGADGVLSLIGHGARGKESFIRAAFPQIDRIVPCPIVRDKRHRARIDRALTLARGAPWLRG